MKPGQIKKTLTKKKMIIKFVYFIMKKTVHAHIQTNTIDTPNLDPD